MSSTDLERLVTFLAEANVQSVVIGGLAATIHGSAQVSYDVDICYERSPANIEKLCRALASLHPSLRGAPKDLPFHLDAPTVLAGLNFTLDTDFGALDLLGEVLPFRTFSEVVENSEVINLFGLPVRVLSLKALILAKRAAGRPKDLLVIRELEALLELRKTSEGQ